MIKIGIIGCGFVGGALKAWLEEQRDKQVTSAMKKIYQAIIDKLDERLEGN